MVDLRVAFLGDLRMGSMGESLGGAEVSGVGIRGV